MDLKDKLTAFKDCLEKEYNILVKLENPEELINISSEKQRILSEIAKHSKEEFEDFKELLQELDFLNKRNLTLINNNISFIDELFSSLFEENVEKYNPYGEISQGNKKGLFNKKI
jgi:Mg2+ and Co2+ transporter CorA